MIVLHDNTVIKKYVSVIYHLLYFNLRVLLPLTVIWNILANIICTLGTECVEENDASDNAFEWSPDSPRIRQKATEKPDAPRNQAPEMIDGMPRLQWLARRDMAEGE